MTDYDVRGVSIPETNRDYVLSRFRATEGPIPIFMRSADGCWCLYREAEAVIERLRKTHEQFLADIRAAIGDPKGKLTASELAVRIADLNRELGERVRLMASEDKDLQRAHDLLLSARGSMRRQSLVDALCDQVEGLRWAVARLKDEASR